MNSHWIWSFGLKAEYQASINFKSSGRKVKNVSQFQTTIPPQTPPQAHTRVFLHHITQKAAIRRVSWLLVSCSQINSPPTLGCSETRRCCPLQAAPRVLRWLWLQSRRVGRLESRGKGTTWIFLLQATSPAQLHGRKCQLKFKVPLHDPNLWDPIKILLHYINVANQHAAHIKLTQVIYQLYLKF